MREKDKGREGEVGLDHLEVGKRSRDKGRQSEREGKIGRMERGMEMNIGDWGREG